MKTKEEDSQSESDNQEIDVDFEFMLPSEIDYHGIKTLLKQTFGKELEQLQDTIITEYIIQKAIGNVVKVDGSLDPFCIMSLLDTQEQVIVPMLEFLIQKSKSNHEFGTMITKKCAIVLNERLINMPPQIIPPLLDMLLKENETVEHINDRLYHEVESMVDQVEDEIVHVPKKKKRELPVFYFQAEDEFLESFAVVRFDYALLSQQSADSRRAFQDAGIEPFRRVLVIPFEKMKDVLSLLQNVLQ